MKSWFYATLILFSFNYAEAHKVGNSQWCLMTTQVHLECTYDDSATCNDARKIIKEFMKNSKAEPSTVTGHSSEGQRIDPVCLSNPEKPIDSSESPSKTKKDPFQKEGF